MSLGPIQRTQTCCPSGIGYWTTQRTDGSALPEGAEDATAALVVITPQQADGPIIWIFAEKKFTASKIDDAEQVLRAGLKERRFDLKQVVITRLKIPARKN